MGNTCKPMAVSFQCMTKFTTKKKKKLKKKKRKTRNSRKALLGFPCQLQVGAKASNRFPCLLPEVGGGGLFPSFYRVVSSMSRDGGFS